ncbi:hypothetical protein FRC02_012132 [Tulasnella sp. 418]|nr:hypothetical protein FRC02_012132 [Tulasnella sp. 418]
MLHLADGIEDSGPVWTSWAFIMERICSLISSCVTSRLHPDGTLNQRIKREAQLSAIVLKYDLYDELDLSRPGDDPAEQLSRSEQAYDEYPESILRSPRVKDFRPDDLIRRHLGVYFVNIYGQKKCKWQHILPYLPESMTRWGKVRRRHRGDKIRGAIAMNPEKNWDSSFIRFELEVDIYAHQTKKKPVFGRKVYYAQLQYLLVVEFTTRVNTENVKIPEPETHVLAYVKPCKMGNKDATVELASFKDGPTGFETPQFIDLNSIDCVVGRVLRDKKWYIIDRSRGVAQTMFIQDGDRELEE